MTVTIPLPPWLFTRHSNVTPCPQPTFRLPIHALDHYASPGVHPPSSRVDPKLKLKPRTPLRLWNYWKYGVVFAEKATEVTAEVLRHHIWGPRKKSWGIEMTIFTALARDAGRHCALVDIPTVRMLMSFAGHAPLPSDALVTPVTFRVRSKQLRGILAEWDAKESGSRELSGEWVVGKRTWQRLQTEWKASGTVQGVPNTNPPKRKERVILYIHGGAYTFSSAAAQRLISIPLSKYTDCRVFALDYRLAPETQFPGPLHDAVIAYLRLVEELHIPAENILICGDSAGGGLSLALLMYLRDNDYPLPSGAILMCPWVDLTMSCESWDSNAMFDIIPLPTADNHMNPIALYLGEDAERYLTHPYVSPLFGDFKGLPPLLIQAGDAEVLRDEITLLAHKATLAGVDVIHELYEDAVHVFHAYPFLDATRRSFESMRNFVRNVLPQHQRHSPQPLGSNTEKELEHEIENEKAIVVRSDGVEQHPENGDVKHRLEESEPAENGNESDEDKSSWARSPVWKRLPGSSNFTLGGAVDEAEIDELEDIPILSLPGLSEFTAKRDPSSQESSLPSPPLSPRPAHRRIQSSASVTFPVQPARPKLRQHRSSHHLRASALTMSSVNVPPPFPSVRRRAVSTSHPDITSLVENWAHSGPANQTLLYRTPSHS